MPEARLERTRRAYDAKDDQYFIFAAGMDREHARQIVVLTHGREIRASDGVRRLLGMTPYIPEGRATFDALIPDRFKERPDEA